MPARPILYAVAIFLGLAALAIPVLLRQIPLPLRLVASFINLLASFALAMVIRQSKTDALSKAKSPED